jgi:hypothetical protein
MRILLLALAAGALLVATPVASATTHHHARAYRAARADLGAPPPNPDAAWCREVAQVTGPALLIPGIGEAIGKCLENHHMSPALRECLVSGGITLGGVLVGGIIGGAAARAIAGGMVGAGTASCLNAIL